MTETLRIRNATAADLSAVTAIYRYHVLNGLASFELDPPDEAEIARRYDEIIGLELPYIVAEIDGRIVGYAYANLYRARPAYRYTVEDSVYIDKDYAGKGIGSALLTDLIAECERGGRRQMIAVIGDSANYASIRLHERFGFARVGIHPAVGWKFGRWVDSVLMQRALGAGAGADVEL